MNQRCNDNTINTLTSCCNLNCQATGNEINLLASFSIFILFSQNYDLQHQQKKIHLKGFYYPTIMHKRYYKHLAFGSQPQNKSRLYDSRIVLQVPSSAMSQQAIKWKPSNIFPHTFYRSFDRMQKYFIQWVKMLTLPQNFQYNEMSSIFLPSRISQKELKISRTPNVETYYQHMCL